jgi:hypothetical protein
MGWFNIDYCIHAANILLLAAYSVRDILWLRLFAVASSLIAIPYFLFQPAPLWAAFGWSVLFSGLNIFQAWRPIIVGKSLPQFIKAQPDATNHVFKTFLLA